MDKIGKVIGVYGSVVDVQFAVELKLPAMNSLLRIRLPGADEPVVLEVAEHREYNICRCLALDFTYGWAGIWTRWRTSEVWLFPRRWEASTAGC